MIAFQLDNTNTIINTIVVNNLSDLPNIVEFIPGGKVGDVVSNGAIVPKQITQEEITATKTSKNTEINEARGTANQSTFPHNGKHIACDMLSRSDIDAVANHIALMGTFPDDFPGAWKATDNSYIVLANVDAFKSLYASMTAQGTANFTHSQQLKATLAAASTIEAINAIVW